MPCCTVSFVLSISAWTSEILSLPDMLRYGSSMAAIVCELRATQQPQGWYEVSPACYKLEKNSIIWIVSSKEGYIRHNFLFLTWQCHRIWMMLDPHFLPFCAWDIGNENGCRLALPYHDPFVSGSKVINGQNCGFSNYVLFLFFATRKARKTPGAVRYTSDFQGPWRIRKSLILMWCKSLHSALNAFFRSEHQRIQLLRCASFQMLKRNWCRHSAGDCLQKM